jgi:15-cis-phytoene synthase
MTGAGSGATARKLLRDELAREGDRLSEALGIPRPPVDGKLLRPMVAWAARGRRGSPGGFAAGALAIQVVHEASLLHDDILDDCAVRRGRPSLAVRAGLGAALVEGDHLLTSAYCLASATGSMAFVSAFSRAVERTVAGEKTQARAAGRWLSEAEYREIVAGKSGELFGVAASLAAHLRGDAEAARRDESLGVRIGCIYQMVDDFLDLCPSAELGKPPLLDLAQRKWTWPLAEAGIQDFPADEAIGDLVVRLFAEGPRGAASPMRRALRRVEVESRALVEDWSLAHPDDDVVPELLESWLDALRATLEREEANRVATGALQPRTPSGVREPSPVPHLAEEAAAAVRAEALRIGGARGWQASFAHHGRSFRFAARLFPPEPGRLVAGVYAFCRLADDLVDRAPDPDPVRLRARLDGLAELVRRAWERSDTGIPLLDEVMGETAARGVPVLYAEELIRGVAMDLEPPNHPDLASLNRYSYRVASVVGLWLTELFGTRDAAVLRRAEALGRAMQLTNILRDVGEDWGRGRLYLPHDHLAAHGIEPHAIGVAVAGGPLPDRWPELVESLIGAADREYELAFEAIPALPLFFQRPVAVAARVYQGIHAEIRANRHDNLTRRAWTSFPAKLRLGGGALLDLRKSRRGFAAADRRIPSSSALVAPGS